MLVNYINKLRRSFTPRCNFTCFRWINQRIELNPTQMQGEHKKLHTENNLSSRLLRNTWAAKSCCTYQTINIIYVIQWCLQFTGKFWHISDLHIDPTYHVTEDRTKVCYSSKGFPASDPGIFGDFMCDSPYKLILSAFSYMKSVDLEPEFMIWTG